MNRNKRGFTLIELLVVVLIIGILAAVAVPQYQKALWKSRVAPLKSYVKAAVQAQQVYYLENGNYANNFNELNIDWPLQPATTPACALTAAGNNAVRKGKYFEIINVSSGEGRKIIGLINSGIHQCAGVVMTFEGRDEEVSLGLFCFEGYFYKEKNGSFCEKLLGGSFAITSKNGNDRYYTLP